ncbi:ABC transporter substrate-binding protein [Desulfolutivibrio sulfoxidireducens]|uniref:ABC transporter substrate-binding protein n=1 Tax=Desulfolutivibrio sulfoxidireducens TaxID=2773299 RepID=UPI0021099D29|nr:ABC transporter substrate-binding protein [Desulfolutivibrio sulfoxidireducens]
MVLTAQAASAGVEITDDFGRRVVLKRPAKRVIALTGAVNETLCGMGLTDLIAARTDADREPAEVAALPSIGTHMRPNLELVLAHRPDVVVQIAGREESLEAALAIERMGIPVAVFEVHDFEGLFSMAERLGALTGETEAAGRFVAGLRERLLRVAGIVSRADRRPTVAVELRYPNLLLAGAGSMAADAAARAGGRLVPETGGKVARLGEEELLRLDPEYYLVETGPMNPDPVPVAKRPLFRELSAVPAGRVAVWTGRRLSRPGPEGVTGVEELARWLHPGLFPAGAPDARTGEVRP